MRKDHLMRRERQRQEAKLLLNAKRRDARLRVQAARNARTPELSCTYVLRLRDGCYKVGGTMNLRKRLADHRREGKLPPFRLYCAIPSNAPLWAERYLHSVLRLHRVRREVYALQPDVLAWLKSLPRLDRHNEPTPPAFSEPVLPPSPVKARPSRPAPAPVPEKAVAPPLQPVLPTKSGRQWRRGRFRTVWHP